jgi:hypothetical protein
VITVLQPQNVQSDSQNGTCTYTASEASGAPIAAESEAFHWSSVGVTVH